MLDEPTSAQDARTAAAIRATIAEQRRHGTTVLLIAHDLRAAEEADWVVVMQDGQVEEQGNHDALCDLRGLYWGLYTEQRRQRVSSAPKGGADGEQSDSEDGGLGFRRKARSGA